MQIYKIENNNEDRIYVYSKSRQKARVLATNYLKGLTKSQTIVSEVETARNNWKQLENGEVLEVLRFGIASYGTRCRVLGRVRVSDGEFLDNNY